MASLLKKYQSYINEKKEIDQDFIDELKENNFDNIYLNSLTLINYKGFKELRFKDGDKNKSHFIGVVGDNASGKTTFIQAIVKSLTWFVNNIEKNGGRGLHIDTNEISVGSDEHAEIEVSLSISNNDNVTFSLGKSSLHSQKSINNNIEDISNLGSLYRSCAKDSSFPLPLIAFYNMSTRTYTNKFPNGDISRLYGYHKALNAKLDTSYFLDVYNQIDNIINADKSEELNQLMKEIEQLDDFDEIGDEFTFDNIQKLNNKIELLPTLLKKLQSLQHPIENNNVDNYKKLYEKLLNKTTEAISTFLPEIDNVFIKKEISKTSNSFFIKKKDKEIRLTDLSQGELALITLIGDLAFRSVILNPEMKNPLDCNGIVLIDEIDLHLHPDWQRNIVMRLSNTFKNIQFIFTTHSPFVISSIDDKDIYYLDDFKIYRSNYRLQGADISRVLEDVFHTKNQRSETDITKELLDYKALVYQNKWKEKEAILLREKLDNFYLGKEILLKELDSYILVKEWEEELE